MYQTPFEECAWLKRARGTPTNSVHCSALTSRVAYTHFGVLSPQLAHWSCKKGHNSISYSHGYYRLVNSIPGIDSRSQTLSGESLASETRLVVGYHLPSDTIVCHLQGGGWRGSPE